MDLYKAAPGVETRWAGFENPNALKGRGGTTNKGAKGNAFEDVEPGETKELLHVQGPGTIRRMWVTLSQRDAKTLRSLRLEMFWDNAAKPAASAPFGDFFGSILGQSTAFENALFSNPETRSYVCYIPMPFREAARITLTNDSSERISHLFYDINFTLGDRHENDMLYFHAHWRRERWTTLGQDFEILPRVEGQGRYLGCNVGVILNPANRGWFGEGEAKIYLDGDAKWPTLVGDGLEDYIGTAWGQGVFVHRYQGCLVADGERGRFTFYRYHIPDPVHFRKDCRVTIQQLGGAPKGDVLKMLDEGVPIKPISIDHGGGGKFVRLLDMDPVPELDDARLPDGWVNYYRQDDYSAVAFFYLDSPVNHLPPIADIETRTEAIE